MKVDRGKFGLAILLVVVVFLLLTGFFWNFVRDTIAVPIYYLIWVSDLTLKSVPQTIYLGVLVGICVIIGFSALLAIKVNPAIESAEPKQVYSSARYLFWRNLCLGLNSSTYSRERLAAESRKLILSILAYQESIEITEAEALVGNGGLSVPKPVRDLVQQKEIPTWQHLSTPENLLDQLRRFFGKAAPNQDDSQVGEIIGFIEQLLEMDYAGNHGE